MRRPLIEYFNISGCGESKEDKLINPIQAIAKQVLKDAGVSSKSSKVDKEINIRVNSLLDSLKEHAMSEERDLDMTDYTVIRSFKDNLRKEIKNICNPGHDLSQKKEREECSRDGDESKDSTSIIEDYANELKNDF